jgi:hypothetical protein
LRNRSFEEIPKNLLRMLPETIFSGINFLLRGRDFKKNCSLEIIEII